MSEDINVDRRRFCGTTVVAFAAAHFSMLGSQDAQSSEATRAEVPPFMTGTNTSFGLLKQIDAGVLNIGYAESGPSLGPAVILLHGWPYDIHSYVDVSPGLASAGYRVIVPHLRGYGTTRFLSSGTLRNGQPSVLALDIIALMDALASPRALWGRTAL
jgi:alpha/beta hydrolase fold